MTTYSEKHKKYYETHVKPRLIKKPPKTITKIRCTKCGYYQTQERYDNGPYKPEQIEQTFAGKGKIITKQIK